MQGPPPWVLCDGGFVGPPRGHRGRTSLASPSPWCPAACLPGLEKWGRTRGGLLISRRLALLPRAPDGPAWLRPKPASRRAVPSRDIWETPLTNGFVQGPGGPTLPQGSSLAPRLGSQDTGPSGGFGCAPGPTFLRGDPETPCRQPLPSPASPSPQGLQGPWDGRGWASLGWQFGNMLE